MTHVVVSGPRDAPPLVILHGYWATLTMWTLNIADFSTDYRVYAIDVDGSRLTFFTRIPASTTPADAALLKALIDSVEIVH